MSSRHNDRRLNLRLSTDLAIWSLHYARKHNTTISGLIRDLLVTLREAEEARLRRFDAEQI